MIFNHLRRKLLSSLECSVHDELRVHLFAFNFESLSVENLNVNSCSLINCVSRYSIVQRKKSSRLISHRCASSAAQVSPSA
jgi:hypothetical protein